MSTVQTVQNKSTIVINSNYSEIKLLGNKQLSRGMVSASKIEDAIRQAFNITSYNVNDNTIEIEVLKKVNGYDITTPIIFNEQDIIKIAEAVAKKDNLTILSYKNVESPLLIEDGILKGVKFFIK